MRSLLLLSALLLTGALAPSAAAQSARLFTPADVSRADLTAEQDTYLAHLERLTAFAGATLFTADLSALGAAQVAIAVEPEVSVEIGHDRTERRADGSYSWFGTGGSLLTSAVLVARNGQLTGTVRADGQLYTIRPLTGGLHAAVRLDESRFVDHEPDFAAVEQASAAHYAEHPYTPASGPLASAGGPTTIYVMVPYTPLAASQVADILALVQLAIDETNQGYINSNVAPRVALAHTFETTQNGSGSFGTDVPRLASTSDGWYDEVHALRDQHGADVVVLITRSYGGSCGRAYTILASNPTEAFAAGSQSCATGYYTFGHEIGHIQGARHNPEADGSTSPFVYGHGKYWPAGSWRTVMSYNCAGGCTRVLHWSNPDVDYLGTPTGDITQRDNARVLDETATDIADFRPDPIPVELVGFEAVRDGEAVRLTWHTASETNNAGFEVQRQSGDTWAALAFIEGHGTTTEARTYAYTDAAPNTAGGTLHYRLKQIDYDGTFAYSPEVEVVLGQPEAFVLHAAYPNPFNPSTTLRFDVPVAAEVRLEVLDLLGRRVALVAEGRFAAGGHAVVWEASSVPSGVYAVRLTAGDVVSVQRVTLLR